MWVRLLIFCPLDLFSHPFFAALAEGSVAGGKEVEKQGTL
jgi:hypothetical protein